MSVTHCNVWIEIKFDVCEQRWLFFPFSIHLDFTEGSGGSKIKVFGAVLQFCFVMLGELVACG